MVDPGRLGDYVSLVGTVSSTSIAFIMPAIIHLLIYAGESKKMLWNSQRTLPETLNNKALAWKKIYFVMWVSKDILIIIFGILGAIIGLCTTLKDFIISFDKGEAEEICLQVSL